MLSGKIFRVFIKKIDGIADFIVQQILNLYTAICFLIRNLFQLLSPWEVSCFKFYSMQEFLFFRIEKTYIKLKFTDILYVQAEQKYVNLVAVEKCFTTLCSFGRVEEILPAEIFCKVHRSYIVSLMHTAKFDNEFVYIGNRKIPISEQYKSVLKNSVITLNCELNSLQSGKNSMLPQQDLLHKNFYH